VIAIGVERLGSHGVDRVGADQRFHIVHIAVGRVLGAGGRPEKPLGTNAQGGQLTEPRTSEDFPVDLIRNLGAGDRDLSLQCGGQLSMGGFPLASRSPAGGRLAHRCG
jgi:hypothetical protein